MTSSGVIKNVLNVGDTIVILVLQGHDGITRHVKSEGRQTMEAFESAFGGVHRSLGRAIIYSTDNEGVLSAFDVG